MKKLLMVILALLLVLPAIGEVTYTRDLFTLFLRYNEIVGNDLPTIKKVEDPQKGSEMDAYTISLNQFATLVVQTKSGTNEIIETMVIASGDGSAISGVTILQTIGAYCGALGFIDKLDQSYTYLSEVGLFEDDALDGRLNTYDGEGYTITFSQIKDIGLMFSAAIN